MKERLKLLSSPAFILGLFLLLFNDHYLKQACPGWVTGKLSDIAGLFIFPLFFTIFFPRYKTHVFLLTMIGFTWWKSPLSGPFIESYNSLGLLHISRVVDVTDFLALLVLPFSYTYAGKEKRERISLQRFIHPLPVIILTAFAFIATSRGPKASVKYHKEYSFQYPIDTLKHRIFFNPMIQNYARTQWLEMDSSLYDTTTVALPRHIARKKKEIFNGYFHSPMYIDLKDDIEMDCRYMEIKMILQPNRKLSSLTLETITYRNCKQAEVPDSIQLIRIFEDRVIRALQP